MFIIIYFIIIFKFFIFLNNDSYKKYNQIIISYYFISYFNTPYFIIMSGFIKEENDTSSSNIKNDVEITLPLESNASCIKCYSLLIDIEIRDKFNLFYCNKCKYDIKFITKTECIKEYLCSESDLKSLKFLDKQNPHKGTWNSMKLYLKDQIIDISKKKYGSLENVEKIKEERKNRNIVRKVKKLKDDIKKVRKATKVKMKEKNTHIHKFEEDGEGISKCDCGLVIEQEEL
ncbi:DNA repair protein RAD14 [Spraguea lophii 42_110]|uniref:DNA repair protein RAD14 n=1 Tax=Spraguea lophii (strain 42_110) TaxID=1358809 RepID=S7XJB6_SPRLO|nr:DNA repair protein RAD14 [Spraguea lophii 42_110]